MKAVAVFPEKREIKLIEHEEPKIVSLTEVKLRMLDVGICGTDKEIANFDYGTPPKNFDYLVIGHESLGEVVEIGPGVDHIKQGDLVVPMVRRPCPHAHCRACQANRQDFCFTGDFTERGIKEAHGFMTELVVDDERYMNVVPRDLRPVAVLIEPLTIAEKALAQVWQVQQRLPWACPIIPGSTASREAPGYCHQAVVLGAGPVGILGAMLLVAAGFETWVYSREPAPSLKANLVESFGAKYLSSEATSVEQLAAQVGSIDLVYEAVGASRLAFDVLKMIGPNSVFVFTGVPGRKAPIEVDTDLITRNLVLYNQVVFGTVNAGREAFEAATRDLGIFMTRWPEAVRSLITNRYPVEAHLDLLLGKVGGIKNVIALDGASV